MGVRFGAFVLALGLYGLLGSPTPDTPGAVEATVGALLILAAFPDVLRALPTCLTRRGEGWERAGWAFFLYALTVPVWMGLAQDNTLPAMVRDATFVVFFLAPLWLGPLVAGTQGGAGYVRGAILWIGLAFSLRSIFPAMNDLLPGVDDSAPLYLAIAPTVLFAAFYLSGLVVHRLSYEAFRPRALAGTAFVALAACGSFLALVLTLQRISLLALAGCLCVWGAGVVVRAPRRAILPALVAVGVAMAGADIVLRIIEDIALKTATVGVNSRLDEARIALGSVSQDWVSALFGRGWGALIPSPASAGEWVNYTHSLLTMLWVKAGLTGLSLALLYVGALIRRGAHAFRLDPILSLALLAPILIDVTLYASYKSLDFGLVLLLAAALQGPEADLTARAYKAPSTTDPDKVVSA
ncbi:MAG TPA: hypothetical protein PKX87_02225 [Alphaproteobacteria bacterium]|nr:hypothetical protein [Alphaproteobacteria bacterium]